MQTSEAQREQAEATKLRGNMLFKKGKYSAAADAYTEGITLAPDYLSLYVNRAVCHRKLEKWEACEADARTALNLSSGHLKANYFLGISLRHQDQHEESCACLERALEAAYESGDSIKDEIWRELAAAKFAFWQQCSALRSAKNAQLKERLQKYISFYYSSNSPGSQVWLHCCPGRRTKDNRQTQDEQDLQELFDALSRLDVQDEVDSAYACTLTMEPFRDPVCTPEGHSYERSALYEHLVKVGAFDPISRTPLTGQHVHPNRGLRAATKQYLDDHPWAWAECTG